MATIPGVRLSSGEKMPVIGLGTSAGRHAENLVAVLVAAMEVGYRHFDTAALYRTEQPLGEAIKEALRRGVIGSRDELFITTKLWCTDNHPDLVLPALKKSLSKLGLEYVDLYLIHFPVRWKHQEIETLTYPFSNVEVLPFEMSSTWAAMEECHRIGLVKSIGVSNFSSTKLSELLKHATIPPAVNQVEMHTSWHQTKLRKFCSENGINVTAWSPLGGYGAPWGSSAVMENTVLEDIAHKKGKTVAQIALRWLYEQGVNMVVKSFNEIRMKENLQIFGWELSEEDREKISSIPEVKGYTGTEHVSPNGPYKTVEELWDGEI